MCSVFIELELTDSIWSRQLASKLQHFSVEACADYVSDTSVCVGGMCQWSNALLGFKVNFGIEYNWKQKSKAVGAAM